MTLEQLSNYEFNSTQDNRNLLAGMLSVQKAEGNLLQVDNSSQMLRKQRFCETTGPFDGELLIVHEAEVHVVSDSNLCMGKQTMNETEIKFITKRWNAYLVQFWESARRVDGEQTQFLFHVFPGRQRT